MKRVLMLTLTIVSLSCFVGCPDYSHQRPVPDYENMTDSAGEGDPDGASAVDEME